MDSKARANSSWPLASNRATSALAESDEDHLQRPGSFIAAWILKQIRLRCGPHLCPLAEASVPRLRQAHPRIARLVIGRHVVFHLMTTSAAPPDPADSALPLPPSYMSLATGP